MGAIPAPRPGHAPESLTVPHFALPRSSRAGRLLVAASLVAAAAGFAVVPGIANGVHGDKAGTTGSPLNAHLGPLASNGGPTQTEALLTGSPAHSAGDPKDCQAFPVGGIDQRGDARHAASRNTCDVGAYDTGK